MNLTLDCEQEADGRWLAEVPELSGVLAYGKTPGDAMKNAQVLALRVIAERLEHGEAAPMTINISVPLMALATGLQRRPGGFWPPCSGRAGD